MVDRASRLVRELAMLRRRPIDGVHIAPNPKDIAECHVVLEGPPDSDYAGGVYHGTFTFPTDYPMSNGPSVKMLTPSGRFKTSESICMSFSIWHPELWNPAWNVSSIALGFLSFMLEACDPVRGTGTGVASLNPQASLADKRRMAAASLAYNMTNPMFVELFPDLIAKLTAPAPTVALVGGSGCCAAIPVEDEPMAEVALVGKRDGATKEDKAVKADKPEPVRRVKRARMATAEEAAPAPAPVTVAEAATTATTATGRPRRGAAKAKAT